MALLALLFLLVVESEHGLFNREYLNPLGLSIKHQSFYKPPPWIQFAKFFFMVAPLLDSSSCLKVSEWR